MLQTRVASPAEAKSTEWAYTIRIGYPDLYEKTCIIALVLRRRLYNRTNSCISEYQHSGQSINIVSSDRIGGRAAFAPRFGSSLRGPSEEVADRVLQNTITLPSSVPGELPGAIR